MKGLSTRLLMSILMVSAFVGINAGNPTDTIMLQEVTILSEKSSAPLFDAPQAYTDIGYEETEDLNLVSVKGISDLVPNLFVPDYGSRITSSIYVRGLGARMDQPVVGLNIDNIPYLNKDSYDFDLPDIASVEMLRGPQSTLYGRNTMGGVISITTLSPLRYQGWRIGAEYGSGNTMKYSAGWYHKFNDKSGLSVMGMYNSTSGFFKNDYTGRKLDHEKQFGGRVKFDWHPGNNMILQNVFSVSKLLQGGYPYESVETGRISYNDTCFYRRFLLSDGLTIRHHGEKMTLTSVTSFQFIDDNMTLDQDFLPLDYFTLSQKKREWALTQDVIFRSPGSSGIYNWIAGIFGFYKHNAMQAPVTFHDFGIANLIENHRNDSNPDYPIEWNTRTFPLNSDFTIPTFGLAAYHQSSVDVGNFHFDLGLRLDYEHSSLDYRSYCSTGYTIYHQTPSGRVPFRNVNIDLDEQGHVSRDFLQLLPKIGIVWNLPHTSDPKNIYLSISKGYKAGGFNTQMFSDVLQQRLMSLMGIGATYDVDDIVGYKPEKSWNYEIGAHLSFLDSRLESSLALFYIDCRDQQLTMFPDGETTGRTMTNAGKTRSFGVEASVTARPVDNLTLTLSYGFTDARFREYSDGLNSYAGKHIPYAPGNTLFAQATYSIPLNLGWLQTVKVGANLRGTGKIYWDDANLVSQDFYLLPGAFVRFFGKHYSLELWGENLSDTKFNTFYFVSIGNRFLQRGKPLRIGATIRIEI